MASLRSRAVAALVPFERGSRYVRDVEALRAHVAPGAKAASPAPPAWLRRRVRVTRGEIAGLRCYRLSPWVDVTMTNPETTAVAPRNPLLGIEALALAGVVYAGPDDPGGPLASPINGDLAGLGHLTILIRHP